MIAKQRALAERQRPLPFSKALFFPLAFLLMLELWAAPAGANPRFDPRRDGFAFSNDTTLKYQMNASGQVVAKWRDGKTGFHHGCFLIVRSTMQFDRFARFAPNLPKVSDDEYRRLLRKLSRIPVWAVERPRLVFPGYRNLYEFTLARSELVQHEIGAWWPTYFRIGNWRMGMPFPRSGQALAARRLSEELDAGRLQAIYVARSLRLNHCLILYGVTRRPGGDLEFQACDPNYAGESAWLRYHAATRTFELQKRFYFNLGTVNVMRVYLSPLH